MNSHWLRWVFKDEWIMFHFIYGILWDVIRNPLTNSIIFQDGGSITNQIHSWKIDSAFFYIMDDDYIILYDMDSANSSHFYNIDHIIVSNVHDHSANYSIM